MVTLRCSHEASRPPEQGEGGGGPEGKSNFYKIARGRFPAHGGVSLS